MAVHKFVIHDDGKRLATGGPLKYEFYGPSWLIHRIGSPVEGDPAIVVPDSGDGIAAELALRILDLLNSETNQEK